MFYLCPNKPNNDTDLLIKQASTKANEIYQSVKNRVMEETALKLADEAYWEIIDNEIIYDENHCHVA